MLKGAFPLAAGFWAVRSDPSLGRWTDRQLVPPFVWLAASAFCVVSSGLLAVGRTSPGFGC
jgi:hypothetical protein